MQKSRQELKNGLENWVNTYKILRKTGNMSDAKKTKNNIDKAIKKLKLDGKTVYGESEK